MLLIVAQQNDLAAVSLVERWRSRGAALITARDLSAPGWKYELPAKRPSRFVAGGSVRSSSDVCGVLTRLPAVSGSELSYVAPEDRSYVSSEMTAFLLAWLSALSCPVLNRPTPNCLCGPNWRIEEWIYLAAGLGIPVRSFRRSTSQADSRGTEPGVPVTIVGQQCFGAVLPLLADYSRRLAAAAGAELLEVHFSDAGRDGSLQDVFLCPDVSRPEVADAILNLFDSRAPC
jgi:hypothetical protein